MPQISRLQGARSPADWALTKHGITIIIDYIMVRHLSTQSIRQRDRALALGVGFFLFAVYLLGYRGGFHSVDEVSMFAVTESLVKFGQLNTDQIAWTQWTTSQREAQGFFGKDGHVYSKKGLAISLAMVPLYWLGLILPGLGMLQTASLLNPIITAITAGLLFRFVRQLGYDERVAISTASFYGLATIAWVYSKYLFSEPLAGLFLLAAAYFLLTFRQGIGHWRAALGGLLAGLAVAARANNLFLVPILGAYLLAISWQRAPLSRTQLVARSSLAPIYYLLGLLPPAIMLIGYNWLRTGNPLQTGYDLTIFSPNPVPGLYKLLFSPLRGLFVYSPLLILSLPGLVGLWRQRRTETGLIVAVTGVTFLLFSVWTSGEGLSWGSRFLVPVVPFLCLALAPVLERALDGYKALFGLLLGLGVLSFFIQLLGVAINPWVYLAQLQADFGGEFFLENTPALSDFRYNQVWGQLRSWSVVNSDVVWWQPERFDAVALGLSLTLIVIAIVNLESQISGSKSRNLTPIAAFVVILLGTYLLLTRYFITDQRQFGPPDDAYTRTLNTAADRAGPNDQIATVAQNHYHVPMNRFKARVPIIGFAQQQPPVPETALPLLKDVLTGQNIWLVAVGFAPAASQNAIEQWLTFNAFKASDEWFDDVRLVWYGVGHPTPTRSINAVLGEELELTSIKLTESPQPGQVLPVEFIWMPLKKPSADYNLFLQLLTADGTLIAQHDGPPNGGYTPTSTWSPGEDISDRHGIILPVDMPAASYRLIAGLYDPATGERLPIEQIGDFVELGLVRVESTNR
ncbi:MAG: hypothetical protein JSV81_20825 [Anaerolineales bacterium]|nr:MAG: hypothetical protein JSV81_20825 [Anaerolineales bacterium]